jgi:NADH-quinone oxidoreductase subunit C
MSEALGDLAAYIKACLGDVVLDSVQEFGELTVRVAPGDIVEVATFLRDDERCRFVSFIDVSGCDYPYRAQRFDVVYHLLSPTKNLRICVKVHVDEETLVPSVTGVWPGADCY